MALLTSDFKLGSTYGRRTFLARGLGWSTLAIHHHQPASIPTCREFSHSSPHFTIAVRTNPPSPPSMPSADTVRCRLSARVKERQQDALRLLPEGARISVALDCWTSPFGQAFMAITGYFIDADWVYREILLGFKPLHGIHTGANLSAVLMETLIEHGIQDRIFGLTTDNASNNKTLVDTLQQSLLQQSSSSGFNVIPCLARVIQLSLNQLLDRLQAVPENETTETKWTEHQITLAKANAQSRKRGISHTLKRIRSLAVFIRASPQRRGSFMGLQSPGQGLMPLQDVKTRWNSTFLMLRHAKRLRGFIMQFCDQYLDSQRSVRLPTSLYRIHLDCCELIRSWGWEIRIKG